MIWILHLARPPFSIILLLILQPYFGIIQSRSWVVNTNNTRQSMRLCGVYLAIRFAKNV